MYTYDQETRDSAGALLISQLEALDPAINMPLTNQTWVRDIDRRTDVSLGHEFTSYTNISFASGLGAGASEKSWSSKVVTAVPTMQLDRSRTTTPMFEWAMEASWSDPELAQAQLAQIPIDMQSYEGVLLKYNMDLDQQAYIGDTAYGVGGLANSASVLNVSNAVTGNWATATPLQILNDVNEAIYSVWAATGFAEMPQKVIIPANKIQYLTQPITIAGSISVMEYIKQNSLARQENIDIDLVSSKWLNTAGVGGTGRIVAYIRNYKYLRFPFADMVRKPMQELGMKYNTYFWTKIGALEIPYPITIAYRDGI